MSDPIKKLITIACALTFIFLFYLFPQEAAADVIVLKNGDRLTGTVTKMEENFLIFTTEYSKEIKIQQSKIKSLSTDSPVEVHLVGDEVLKGRIEAAEDGGMKMKSSAGRGASAIDWSEVTSINPTPPVPTRWEGNVTLGAGLQSGNTDRANASLGAEASRRTERDRFSLRFLFNYAEENKKMNTRNTYGALKYDYFFTPAFFGYVGVEMLNDRFKDLSLRTVVGPGLGYQVWDSKVKFLLFEAGASYFSENLLEGEDSSWITGRLASTIRYRLFDRVSLSDLFVIYPSFKDFGEYQLRNEASISSNLTTDWSLNLTNILERDSNPPVGVEKNDIQWILGLKYSF